MDFYVESIIDGMYKGTFRSDTQSNWHRKHKQHHATNNNNSEDYMFGGERERFQRRKWFDRYQHKDKNGDTSSTSNTSSNGSSKSNGTNALLLTHRKTRIRVDASGIEVPSSYDNGTIAANVNTLGYNSYTKKMKRMKNSNHLAEHCTQEYWYENVYSTGSALQLQKKWSFNRAEFANKTVSFR